MIIILAKYLLFNQTQSEFSILEMSVCPTLPINIESNPPHSWNASLLQIEFVPIFLSGPNSSWLFPCVNNPRILHGLLLWCKAMKGLLLSPWCWANLPWRLLVYHNKGTQFNFKTKWNGCSKIWNTLIMIFNTFQSSLLNTGSFIFPYSVQNAWTRLINVYFFLLILCYPEIAINFMVWLLPIRNNIVTANDNITLLIMTWSNFMEHKHHSVYTRVQEDFLAGDVCVQVLGFDFSDSNIRKFSIIMNILFV